MVRWFLEGRRVERLVGEVDKAFRGHGAGEGEDGRGDGRSRSRGGVCELERLWRGSLGDLRVKRARETRLEMEEAEVGKGRGEDGDGLESSGGVKEMCDTARVLRE